MAGVAGAAVAPSETSLELHTDFYPPEVVAKAASAFTPVADCTVEPRGPYLRVHLRARDGRDAVLLGRQLANWALAAGAVDRG